MSTKLDEKTGCNGEKFKVVGPEYEPGAPEQPHRWRAKLHGRAEMLKYLRTGERYWFSKEWYGSERRKNPA